jgi:site-specific DNA-methyltransferase (adenine-specific)
VSPYYEHGGITIYLGDCREVLPRLGSVEHVITDPPYDTETHAGARTSGAALARPLDARGLVNAIAIDFDPLDVPATVPVLVAIARRWVIAFCSCEMLGAYRTAAGEAWIRAGFWHKSVTPQFSGDRPGQPGEGIAIMHRSLAMGRRGRMRWNSGGASAFYDFPTVKHWRTHPTEKPEALMAALVSDFTDADDCILDPYMGGGTTLAAAKRLGRRAIGIEINERYCEIAARRLQQEALPLTVEHADPRLV